jgi:hypothetical protein
MSQLCAMLLSIALEAAIGASFVAALGWGNPLRAALAAALGTLMTHWAAWWGIIALEPDIGYWPAVLLLEGAVILVESIPYLLLVPLRPGHALSASLAANAASAGFGLALYAFDLI